MSWKTNGRILLCFINLRKKDSEKKHIKQSRN